MSNDYKILIVDDHRLIIDIVSKSLNAMGYKNIRSATNGIEALEALKTANKEGEAFDIMFLDWNMPEMDGFAVLEKCRGDAKYDKMAIVMISAEAEKKNILKAIKAGATSYITKPTSQNTLADKITELSSWLKKSHELHNSEG